MTRKFFSLATVALFPFIANAQNYYYGQNSYYTQNGYYAPPPDSGNNSAASYSTPRHSVDDYLFTEDAAAFFRADIGLAFLDDGHLTHFGVPANDPVKFKPGLAIDTAVGFDFNKYLAADLDFGFIGAKVDSIKFFTSNDSHLYNFPILANITGSYPLRGNSIVPYAGAGAGGSVAVFDADNLTTPGNPTINGRSADLVFAWQLFLGVRFQLNPSMWLGAEYKYFNTSDPTWDYPGNFKFGMTGVKANAILFTFEWKFW
jgi:opacity protein-like surface antigen